LRVCCDIAQALELGGRASFRLLVNRRIKEFAVESEADWNDVRLAGSIGRGEMGDPSRAEKA
jgi:hypothetical protein